MSTLQELKELLLHECYADGTKCDNCAKDEKKKSKKKLMKGDAGYDDEYEGTDKEMMKKESVDEKKKKATKGKKEVNGNGEMGDVDAKGNVHPPHSLA